MAVPSRDYQGLFCSFCCREKNRILLQDPAIQRYFTSLRSRPKSYGYISEESTKQTLGASRRFLLFLDKNISAHAISNLTNEKKLHPQNFTLDDNLELFSNQQPIKMHRVMGARILGIFKANRARLQATSDTNFQSHTQPIADKTLRKIWGSLDREKQLVMEYQAYAGERVKAICKIPLQQIDFSYQDYALLHVDPIRNKSRLDHHSLVPKSLMREIIELASSLSRNEPFPNYRSLWTKISSFSRREYGVNLTSHYLRKRFHSIAEETPMPVNYWLYLMGQKKSFGHLPTYSLTFIDRLLEYYHKYLAPRLPLDRVYMNIQEPTNTTTLLLEQIISLRKELSPYRKYS